MLRSFVLDRIYALEEDNAKEDLEKEQTDNNAKKTSSEMSNKLYTISGKRLQDKFDLTDDGSILRKLEIEPTWKKGEEQQRKKYDWFRH